MLDELAPAIVLSPSPHDAHPRHEATAQATAIASAATADPPVWWQWGLWADLPSPTLYVPFDDDVLVEAQHVLAAYAGELARNDYARLLEARAVAHAVLGERTRLRLRHRTRVDAPYAELLTECRLVDGLWLPGSPRLLDPAAIADGVSR